MMNWKTSLMGVGTILVAVGMGLTALFDDDAATTFDIATFIAALTTGIGLIFAKDAVSKAITGPPGGSRGPVGTSGDSPVKPGLRLLLVVGVASLLLAGCMTFRNTYTDPTTGRVSETVYRAGYVPWPWSDGSRNAQSMQTRYGNAEVSLGQSIEGGTNSAIITVPVGALSGLLKSSP